MTTTTNDLIGTLATLVSTIDDPDFDASQPDQVRDLVQYISTQCRAMLPVRQRPEAYHTGYEAAAQGEPLTACPYPNEWFAGYSDNE